MGTLHGLNSFGHGICMCHQLAFTRVLQIQFWGEKMMEFIDKKIKKLYLAALPYKNSLDSFRYGFNKNKGEYMSVLIPLFLLGVVDRNS